MSHPHKIIKVYARTTHLPRDLLVTSERPPPVVIGLRTRYTLSIGPLLTTRLERSVTLLVPCVLLCCTSVPYTPFVWGWQTPLTPFSRLPPSYRMQIYQSVIFSSIGGRYILFQIRGWNCLYRSIVEPSDPRLNLKILNNLKVRSLYYHSFLSGIGYQMTIPDFQTQGGFKCTSLRLGVILLQTLPQRPSIHPVLPPWEYYPNCGNKIKRRVEGLGVVVHSFGPSFKSGLWPRRPWNQKQNRRKS